MLSLSILAAFLVIGILFLSIKPDEGLVALQPTGSEGQNLAAGSAQAENAIAENAQSGAVEAQGLPRDDNNILNLKFLNEQQTHHYRKNDTAGTLLIITGRVSNGYPDRRSFIRVKAMLKNGVGEVVAERQSFAGNFLSEDEIKTLPIQEIQARLSLRGGLNGANQNIPPGKAIPFMIIFDRLPSDLAEYVVEPVSSSPASDSLSALGGPSNP
jgi:hypothetical protein